VQVFLRDKIDPAAPEKLAKLLFHIDDTEAYGVSRFKLDQDIDIALGIEILPQHRTIQGQLADVMPPTEGG
jgi:hypothetical protein